jgi:hypothetical protein
MSSRLRAVLVSILAALMVVTPINQLFAQPTTQNQVINVTYSLGESLTLTVSSNSYTIGTSAPITATASWNLSGADTSHDVELDAYLGGVTNALMGAGSAAIPSSAIQATETTNGQNGTSAPTACNGTDPYSTGGACPTVFLNPLTSGTPSAGTVTSTIALAVPNTAGIAAGTYTGTLTLSLQAY